MRGGYWGNWCFIQLVRFLGVRYAYAPLAGTVLYYLVAAPQARRASRDFLARALGPQPFWKWPILIYRHLFSFGVMLLDRVAVISCRVGVECEFDGETQIREHLDSGRGVILLGAHVGNWEIGGHLLSRLGRPVNVVMLEREEESVRELYAKTLGNRRFRILTADDHPLRSVPIIAALKRGEIVALHGDRSFGGEDLRVPFLGGEAPFPVGPYLLAAASGAPLFQVFAVRERIGRYRFFTFPATFLDRSLLRKARQELRPFVETYAARLAKVAQDYPFQWHNLYPYWDDPYQPCKT